MAERRIRLRSDDSNPWVPGTRVVALASQKWRHIHIGTAVTSLGEFVTLGEIVLNHPCETPDEQGCLITGEVKALRRVLTLLEHAEQITIRTGNARVAQLVTDWLNGTSDSLPDWYKTTKERNAFTVAMGKLDPQKHRVELLLPGMEGYELITIVREFNDIIRAAMTQKDKDRDWALAEVMKLTAGLRSSH